MKDNVRASLPVDDTEFPAYSPVGSAGTAPSFTREVAEQLAEHSNALNRALPHSSEDQDYLRFEGNTLVVHNDLYPDEDLRIEPDSNGRYCLNTWLFTLTDIEEA